MVMRRCLNVKKTSSSMYDNMESLSLNCPKKRWCLLVNRIKKINILNIYANIVVIKHEADLDLFVLFIWGQGGLHSVLCKFMPGYC